MAGYGQAKSLIRTPRWRWLDCGGRVDELESDLARLRVEAPQGTEDLSQGDDFFTIRYSFHATEKGTNRSDWTAKLPALWNQLFAFVAPHMIDEASDSELRRAVQGFVASHAGPMLRTADPKFKDKELGGFQINEEDFQTIRVQLRALGLIAKSNKARSVQDGATYWTLTPYGDGVMNRLRAIRRPGIASTPTQPRRRERSKSDKTAAPKT